MMTYGPLPPKYAKTFEFLRELGARLLPPTYPELEIRGKLLELDLAAHRVEEVYEYPNEVAMSRDQYLSAIAFVFAEELSEDLGWEIAWVKMVGEGDEDGYLGLLDRDRRFLLYPYAAVIESGASKVNACQSVYEKVVAAELPDQEPGSLYEIRA